MKRQATLGRVWFKRKHEAGDALALHEGCGWLNKPRQVKRLTQGAGFIFMVVCCILNDDRGRNRRHGCGSMDVAGLRHRDTETQKQTDCRDDPKPWGVQRSEFWLFGQRA